MQSYVLLSALWANLSALNSELETLNTQKTNKEKEIEDAKNQVARDVLTADLEATRAALTLAVIKGIETAEGETLSESDPRVANAVAQTLNIGEVVIDGISVNYDANKSSIKGKVDDEGGVAIVSVKSTPTWSGVTEGAKFFATLDPSHALATTSVYVKRGKQFVLVSDSEVQEGEVTGERGWTDAQWEEYQKVVATDVPPDVKFAIQAPIVSVRIRFAWPKDEAAPTETQAGPA